LYEGILHGNWLSEVVLSTSDRRLKTSIAPLHQTLLSYMSRMKAAQHEELGTTAASGPASFDGETGNNIGAKRRKTRQDAVDWVLRELRPVSFTLKKGLDSKTMQGTQRYGFVAQEIERQFPDLIRDSGTKAMVYQDVIAMITLAAQDHQERLESHGGEVGKLRSLLKRLGEKLGHLQKRVALVIGPHEKSAGRRSTAKSGQPGSK
jgi:hypothetical protein